MEGQISSINGIASAAIRYALIFIMALYVFYSFTRAFKEAGKFQKFLVYLFHLLGNVVIFLNYPRDTVVIFYGAQLIFLIFLMELFPVFYENAKKNLLCHMGMLLAVSFMMMSRLDITMEDSKAYRQFAFLCCGFVVFCLLPVIYRKIRSPKKLGPFCFAAGLLALILVMVIGAVTMGAKLSISIGPISVQPSEFVKITYVFFLAAYLSEHHTFKHVLISAALAGAHMIVLVLSTDLGATLIFGVTYLVMVYCATGKKRYLGGGGLIGLAGAACASLVFSHVQERILAWIDPWSVIDDEGYQITQSLFAIGTGGFTGSGLFQGSPESIPVVYKDFIFSAIAEEFGGLFAILLILLYLNCFLSMIMIGMRQTDKFGKTMISGFAALFATQIFLTIGGDIKLIPSTGVTLPFVSYGGSSLLSTMIMFGLIEALQMQIVPEDGSAAGRREMTRKG